MFLSDSEFEERYGTAFRALEAEYKRYVAEPEALCQKIAADQENEKKRWKEAGVFPEPRPDAFRYSMTYYRGLVENPRRLKNYIVAKNEPLGRKRVSLPVRIDIEPISRCNFRCVMCQVSAWPGGKRGEDMKLSSLRKLIDEQYGLCEVKLQGMGEPLMNPDFIEMVELMAQRSIWVRTTTNGSLLHVKDNHQRLADSGIGEITASFDGASKEVFEGIRRKSHFAQVVDNFTLLNRYANSQNRLLTRMWVVLQKENRHQLLDFLELAKQMEFRRLTISLGLSDWGQQDWSATNSELQVERLTGEETSRLDKLARASDIELTFWNLQEKYSTDSPDKLCRWPFDWSYVGSDSRVTPCCMIGNPDVMELGQGESFSRVWNNETYQEFRQAHLDGRIPGPCRNCYALDNEE